MSGVHPRRLAVTRICAQVMTERRLQAGLSQEELAHRSGIDRTYPSMIEHCKRHPTLEIFINLCAGLGVPADVVLKDIVQRLAGAPRLDTAPPIYAPNCVMRYYDRPIRLLVPVYGTHGRVTGWDYRAEDGRTLYAPLKRLAVWGAPL